ncbi:MAG TPA: hypothetical protein PKA36_14710 [Pseudoxanthomonas mexicana]|nr:hypothetical protein [Pseudoxanthomonas mexicana]
MKWTTRQRGQYHIESIPARFFVAEASVAGVPRFTLADSQASGSQLVGVYDTEAEAKAAAEELAR